MAIKLPEAVKKLLADKAYGHVLTFSPKGKAQMTMVWMDVDGDTVLINTATGRNKERNIKNDPRIQVSVQNRDDPQSYVLIEGKGTLTEEGADANIDKLAKRFLGMDKYPWRTPTERRILIKIQPERISGFAPGMQPWK
jgi:PPOX class probable F420-dependent enzyme